MAGYQLLRGSCCPECVDSKVFGKDGILPQHYTASQIRRSRIRSLKIFDGASS